MSSIHQVSPRKSNNPSGLQKATTPELQITSDDKEADIWAKMAEHKQRKAAREEAAWLEAERLEREERLEAKRKEQERLEAKCWEQEARAQQKAGELKGKAQDKGTSAAGAGSCKQCKKGWVLCTFSRAQQRSGVPGESEAGPSGVVASTTTSSDPLVAAVTKGFELIAAAIDRQTVEVRARRETQRQFNSQLGDLLGEFEFVLRPTPLASESSKELHSDMAALELESLQLDCEGAGVELDERIMH
ncbi:hypothetical protein M404DRAFT_21208 [Pisolithus tinctorius Marx 270]|uniref:Uncharacterized protein n=1 Tax=Pisolithus tinctorius Marx 270 TaxID=870435 RepID=A0A0C3P9I7_PISTI|nr:hypothetical protein M404DRAFT_21208 [Pisolithus tinctorius Marx 270]